jgi:hypothetical protein
MMRPQCQRAIAQLAAHARYRRRFLSLFMCAARAAIFYESALRCQMAEALAVDALKEAALDLWSYANANTPCTGVAVMLNPREKLFARAVLAYGESRDGGRLGVAAFRFARAREGQT